MKILIFTLLFSSVSHAWTLNNNFGASFKSHKVKVYVDQSTVCPNNQLTADDLEELIKPSISNFWNRVPTSKLELKAAGFSDPVQHINDGRLCSPTDDKCITEGENSNNLIPAVSDIVIACNDNVLNFGGGNVLAVTIPNKFSGKKITGAVILINDGSTTFGDLSKSDRIGVIAHEIGHAIGLGHSEESAALMYYRTVNQRKRLGQDDVDGVSFLYPVEYGDMYGLCGTIAPPENPRNPPFLQMGIALGILVLMFEIVRFLKSLKTRATA